MTNEEMAGNYDQLAEHWAGEKFNRENGLEQHLRALQFLEKRGTAIDVGCGSSGRFVQLLIEEGFGSVEGLDFSKEMLRLAMERHPEVVFHHAEVCEWEFPRKYDFITAWDGVWHVELGRQEAMLEKLCEALDEDGVLIFTTGGLDEPGEATNPFLGVDLYHAALGIPKTLEVVARCGCIVRHLEYDQYPEKHLYLVVQKVGS
ncbi:class I SAM-dependent methyltransferase [Luteolibacter sp. AS25]|uniref:class I SAM-dependent methyltransferase n=1 Tax=Luteolibacter sp. AS25 TaxID=3135776 RepID=UPI00398BB904